MVIFKKPHEMTGLTLRYETTSLLQLNYFSVILLKKKKKTHIFFKTIIEFTLNFFWLNTKIHRVKFD
jgi:hypothetical protein